MGDICEHARISWAHAIAVMPASGCLRITPLIQGAEYLAGPIDVAPVAFWRHLFPPASVSACINLLMPLYPCAPWPMAILSWRCPIVPRSYTLLATSVHFIIITCQIKLPLLAYTAILRPLVHIGAGAAYSHLHLCCCHCWQDLSACACLRLLSPGSHCWCLRVFTV